LIGWGVRLDVSERQRTELVRNNWGRNVLYRYREMGRQGRGRKE